MLSQTTGSVTECLFKIRTQEVDVQKYIKPSALIMLMQEASMQNVLDLRASVWDLSRDKVSWVLLRKEITFIRTPMLGEMIKIKTYPAGFDRVFAYRDYLVYDDKDVLIAQAASSWTLMNTETRKLQRIPEQFFHLAFNGEVLPLPERKLSITKTFGSYYDYVVRMGDIDWNSHVNNIVLSKLMVQGAPTDILKNHRLSKYTFHIKSECLLNEEIRISSETVEPYETHHKIEELGGERLIAIAKCEWE